MVISMCYGVYGKPRRRAKISSRQSEAWKLHWPNNVGGGVKAAVYPLFFDPQKVPFSERRSVLRNQLRLFRTQLTAQGVIKLQKGSDFHTLLQSRAPGGLLAIEGVEGLQGDLNSLAWLHEAGVRQIGLTWNLENEAACGCHVANDTGLKPWGRELLTSMANHQGPWILDLAHAGPKTFRDVLNFADPTLPILVSHSASRHVFDHPRNLTDEQLRQLFRRKGLFGLALYPPILGKNPKKSTYDTVRKHIEHILELGGEDYLFFGSDFDGMGSNEPRVKGLKNAGMYPEFTKFLENNFGYIQTEKWTWSNSFKFYKKSLEKLMVHVMAQAKSS